jgi:hypothetical protein
MNWTDGSRYEGEWVKGIQHGMGSMTFPDGTIKQGYFENNIYKGPLKPRRNTISRNLGKDTDIDRQKRGAQPDISRSYIKGEK